MTGEDDKVVAYREAYETWQRHLAGLHEVFLEGKRANPVQLKGLLNRESRSKRRYDAARLKLLGIEDDVVFDDEDESSEP